MVVPDLVLLKRTQDRPEHSRNGGAIVMPEVATAPVRPGRGP
jgi:hypothetical protein